MSDNIEDKLYEAVTEYVNNNGGVSLLGAGISVTPVKAPDKIWDEFLVCVKICGKLPKKSKKNNKSDNN